MGVLYTISVDYFKLPRADYAKVFSTSLIIPAVFSLLLVPVLYSLQGILAAAFSFDPSFVWLIPFCLFLNFCFEAFIILVRNQNNIRLFTIVSFLKAGIEIALSIVLIVWLYQSWYSRALAFFIAGLAVAGLFFYHTHRHHYLTGSISTKILRKELYFGLSGMVLQTAIFFINTSDKFFVMSFFGKEQAGFYAVAGTFATIQYIVCVSLLQYLQPVLFSGYAAGKRWHDVKQLFYKYFGAMTIAFVAVNAFTVIVYRYMLPVAYGEHLHYFYLLSVSSFLWTIANIFLQFIVFEKNKRVLVQISVSVIVAAIGINYFSAEFIGITGVAAGQLLTNMIVIGMLLLYNKKLQFFRLR